MQVTEVAHMGPVGEVTPQKRRGPPVQHSHETRTKLGEMGQPASAVRVHERAIGASTSAVERTLRERCAVRARAAKAASDGPHRAKRESSR